MTNWNINDSLMTYNIARWGDGYFTISGAGNLVASSGDDNREIDLIRVSEIARQSGLPLPLLLRFPHILRDRIHTLCDSFDKALTAAGSSASYHPVYPIKVNQNKNVVEELIASREDRLGLEAGSKPELLTVLSLSTDNGIVVCNGYKDREYIRLALAGSKMGLRVYIVIEKLSELDIVLSEYRKSGIKPSIGIRLKLASIASGKWQSSGGERSKFGLTASQVIMAVERLRETGLIDCLELLHIHLGSQVSNIRDIQNALGEAAQFFVQLSSLGVNVRVVDVGGGLAIDYEGSSSRTECSMNYQYTEYANTVVQAFDNACKAAGFSMPDIFTESGRALTAHHAVLVCDVTEIERHDRGTLPQLHEESHELLLILEQLLAKLDQGSPVTEIYHNALYTIQEIHRGFNQGNIDLATRSLAEQYYYAICQELVARLNPAKRAHQEILSELHEILADKVFCNFSIFQSMPDVWAIDQIFPIVPLQRLHEQPSRRAILHDLTCDSDGRIDLYVENDGIENTLPIHDIEPGERYLLGFFLVGAYQETLGDIHNLFGDTAAANISLDNEGNIVLDHIFAGENVSHLLARVEYDPDEVRNKILGRARAARLPDAERNQLLLDLESSLESYSYLVKDELG